MHCAPSSACQQLVVAAPTHRAFGENAVEALTILKKLWTYFFSTNNSTFLNQRGWNGLRQNILDFESLHHLGFWMLQQWLQPLPFLSTFFCLFNIFSSLLDPKSGKKDNSDFKSKQRHFCFRDLTVFSQLLTRHFPRPIIKSRAIN